MRLEKKISGRFINLRSALPDDAEFILSLRLNEKLNKYLKSTDPSVEAQKIWIDKKLNSDNDYHMIIELKDNMRVGVIAVYDIENGSFEWGRWLISPNQSLVISIESCYLMYNFSFNTLGLKTTNLKVRKENLNVFNFHINCGCKIVNEDDVYTYISLEKKSFNHPSNFLQKSKYRFAF